MQVGADALANVISINRALFPRVWLRSNASRSLCENEKFGIFDIFGKCRKMLLNVSPGVGGGLGRDVG